MAVGNGATVPDYGIVVAQSNDWPGGTGMSINGFGVRYITANDRLSASFQMPIGKNESVSIGSRRNITFYPFYSK